ncbi:secreted RxLR effector protein 161-like [Dioscorea cayenensis subsp. rotundata]|uniref:Secreted RxLR effector protein 161-like n=1 Tax=Dioscorea cayennensis subsp. rotundata TaxID=55577 RepID=A0AB40C7G1_DIOCR|nr:secreted RxLR effector protein 161-like [Dioscorea cayenensis subsp. rotundata]
MTGMADCNSCKTPMVQRLKLHKKSEDSVLVDATFYHSIISSLRYLVNMRPDMAYAVGIMSRFMEKPTSQHLTVVKQIMRYIRGTLDLGCYYTRTKKGASKLVGYSDSYLTGDVDDQKSTTRVAYFIGGNLVTWVSQKQKVMALSLCEAKYVAAITAACQGIWLNRLLADRRGQAEEEVVLKVDNKSAISLCKNLVHHDRSKHINTHYHFIRECVENGKIVVDYVTTEEQLADILTKLLGRVKFLEMRHKIEL